MDGTPATPTLLLEIRGPDPKGRKAEGRAFHASTDGEATFSASGLLWTIKEEAAILLGPASLVSSFWRKGEAILGALQANVASAFVPYTRQVSPVCRKVRMAYKRVDSAIRAWLRLWSAGSHQWEWAWRSATGQNTFSATQSWVAVFACRLECSPGQCAAQNFASSLPQQGSEICCKGSPFGCLAPTHFQSYLSRGTVASLTDMDGSFFLADMHCLPGMEGAAVWTSDGRVVGMLAKPLSSSTFDAQVPIVISAQPLALAFEAWWEAAGANNLSLSAQHSSHIQNQSDTWALKREEQPSRWQIAGASALDHECHRVTAPSPGAASLADAVVAVTSNNRWASGVIISRDGLILTVAHILEERTPEGGTSEDAPQNTSRQHPNSWRKLSIRVRVGSRASTTSWLPAELVYLFSGSLDLAVLKIRCYALGNPSFCPPQLAPGRVRQGQHVFVIGHALFNPRQQIGPLVSSGVVARVLAAEESGRDVMIITTAAVYPGASGGAVFSPTGLLLGLATSNTRHAKSGRSYARLNYSIAADALRPIWIVLQEGGLSQAQLAALDEESEDLQSMWSLKAPPRVLRTADGGAKRLSELLQQSRLGDSILTGSWGASKL